MMHKRTLPLIAPGTALLLALAGCSSPATPGEQEPATDEQQEPATDSEPQEQTVQVLFDGEPLDFSEIHCSPSPGNEGRMRLFAQFQDGEITVDATDNGAEVTIDMEDGATFYSREPNGIDFDDGLAQGDVEVSDAEDNLIVVTLDLAC